MDIAQKAITILFIVHIFPPPCNCMYEVVDSVPIESRDDRQEGVKIKSQEGRRGSVERRFCVA